MAGEYEPNDSRNVTGQGSGDQGGMASPGGSNQQEGQQRWGGDSERTAPGMSGQTASGGSDSGASRGMGQMDQSADRGLAGQAARQPNMDGPVDQQAAMEGRSPGQMNQSQGQQSQGFGGQASAASGTEQQQQYASGQGQMGGMNTQMGDAQLSASEAADRYSGQIRAHMEVIGADDVHVGTVDAVEGHRIKLTRADSGMGSHAGHHHYLSCGLIAGVEGDRVRLSTTGTNAQGMLEER